MTTTILFVDHANGIGGAENSLLLLLGQLNRSRWQPQVATADGLLAEAVEALGLPAHRLPLPRLRRSMRFSAEWGHATRTLTQLAQEANARILYANTVRAAFYAAAAARLARRPFIWHMRDFWLSETRPKHLLPDRLLKRLLLSSAALVIVNSHATATHLPQSNKVTVVHNGIDIDRFDPIRRGVRLRQQLNIPLDAPLIGMVGRLRPWKGPERFIRVAAQVASRIPRAHFIIVGGNPFGTDTTFEESLKQLAATSRLETYLHFTGQIDDVASALAAFDVFVHPGDPEPFGLVNIEAMAMAKPVVAFAHGALPEIVVDGVTGLLVPPFDEQGMADAIVDLLDSAEKRAQFGRAGRQRINTHFSIRRVASEIDHHLSTIVGMTP